MSTPDRPLGNFEEQLLTELKTVVATGEPAARPAARRIRPRLAIAAGALVAAAAAVAVAEPSLVGLGASPAYAVERNPDGSIRIDIFDYRDPAGLQQRLADLGVRAAVDFLPEGITCRESRADFVPADRVPLQLIDWEPMSGAHHFKLRPEHIGPGQTFVYTVQEWQNGDDHVQRAAIRLANGPVAGCERVPGDIAPGR